MPVAFCKLSEGGLRQLTLQDNTALKQVATILSVMISLSSLYIMHDFYASEQAVKRHAEDTCAVSDDTCNLNL